MNKNLKKVISAVAALAMSASSFVALAATYPDVDASASYKQAIDELSALKVIEGYEDGTFQPDKLVNRAEFAKMAITASGSADLAQAESAMGQDTEFTDVTGDHWASGYVTAATAQGIVNGMGDGTYAPDANITYAQAMKMLVCLAGYQDVSEQKGGYPNGYLYYGNQLKIGSGVTGVTDATEITRAQCAQMIANVLTAPVRVDTGEYDYDMNKAYPKFETKDGYGEDYQTILIKNHDIYKVKGTVTATNRSDSNVKKDEVNFTVQNARNWLDNEDQITKSKGNAEELSGVKIGDSGVENYLRQYVEVLIQETDDDEYLILTATLAGQTDEKVLEADDHDYENSNYESGDYVGAGKLYFYSNSKTTSYKIDENVALYVNGVEYDDVNGGIDLFVNDNTTSQVTLVDTPSDDSNSTDGKYDLIFVDYYATLVVDYVDDADTDEPTINMLDDDQAIGTWDIDYTDDDKSYSFTKDGAEISVADLAQYDVLSVKYNVAEGDFDDSHFYEAVVSSATETGKYSLYNSEDKEYTVNGTVYKVNDTLISQKLENGTTYVFYIDAFGTIAYTEEEDSAKKLAIIDSVYDVEGGSAYEAKLILADGTSVKKTIKETSTNDGSLSEEVKDAMEIVYVNGSDGAKNPVQNRVVKYNINTSDEISKLTVQSPKSQEGDTGEYKVSSGKIGSVKISDVTAFLSVEDTSDIKAMSASAFVDGNDYTVYAFDKSSSDSIYRLVLVATGTGEISATTHIAVFNQVYNTSDDNDNDVDALEVFINGAKEQVNCESGIDASDFGLVRGDVIMYATNDSGEIKNVVKMFSGVDMSSSTDDVWAAAKYDSDALIATAKTYVQGLKTSKYTPDLYFGAIVGRTSNSVELSAIKESVTNVDDSEDISYDSEYNVYTIDYNEKASDRIAVGSAGSVVKTNIASVGWTDYGTVSKNDEVYVNWDNNGSNTNPRLALVKTLDGDATDIVVIIPKK